MVTLARFVSSDPRDCSNPLRQQHIIYLKQLVKNNYSLGIDDSMCRKCSTNHHQDHLIPLESRPNRDQGHLSHPFVYI